MDSYNLNSLPLVSVLIPAYNAEKYIAEALDSILTQTYPNLEIIVVNDGSTDATANILDEYAKLGVIAIHQKNKGQSAANNLAFEKSTGNFIKFFDADDILSENHIELQVERLSNHPNCVASCEICRFYEDDLSQALFEPLATWVDLDPIEWLVIDNGKGIGMMQASTFLIPRNIINRAGLWREDLSLINDMDFSPRILINAEKVLFCPGAKLYYRSGLGNNLSAQRNRESLLSSFKALESATQLLLNKEDSYRIRNTLARTWRVWSYKYYPTAMDLYFKSEDWIKKLGGSPHFYHGGISGKMKKIIGWKLVKRLQVLRDEILKRK